MPVSPPPGWPGASPQPARIPSGFSALDEALGGGWPAGVLTEILVPAACSGELSLLSPALAWLTGSAEPRWVMFIAPPRIPYAPGLAGQGLVPGRVLAVRIDQPAAALWAMGEALGSGACAGVITWAGSAGATALKKLHLLAGRRQALSVLIRAAHFRRERSPARLRLCLQQRAPRHLQLEIFRNARLPPATVILERKT
ncbi:MAG: translesion DNA synthesis-associated protein ImuA [Gammaproteobacteria bacterium]|nr:translesion DNA synthesis-associated protein ImuA [Gammaproteobacteria bacterium]